MDLLLTQHCSPQYVMFPEDEQGFGIDDQFYLGSSGLLCKPVTTRGATSATVYLSDAQVYYDYFSLTAYRPSTLETAGRTVTVPAALHQIPLFIRGGSILATRERPRRSSPLMKHDPFTLRVALDVDGSAKGELYLDDGEGFGYQRGELVWRALRASTTHHGGGTKKREIVIRSDDLAAAAPANAFASGLEEADVRVERVVVVGVDVRPASASVVLGGERARELEWTYEAGDGERAGVVVVKDPGVGITKDWAVVIGF
jgi:alpha 1,3-glucosidase